MDEQQGRQEAQGPKLLTVSELAAMCDAIAARQAEAVIVKASVSGSQSVGVMLGALLCEMKALRATMHVAMVASGYVLPDPPAGPAGLVEH